MITRKSLVYPSVRASLAFFAVAAALAVWTLSRALRIDVVPDAAASTVNTSASLAGRPVAEPIDVGAVVEADPFAPDRGAPLEAYRFPGEPRPDAPDKAEPPKPTVLGTVVATDGRSFASVQLGDDGPKIVRVGEKIGIYTVKSIERGRVVFTTPADKRIEVSALR